MRCITGNARALSSEIHLQAGELRPSAVHCITLQSPLKKKSTYTTITPQRCPPVAATTTKHKQAIIHCDAKAATWSSTTAKIMQLKQTIYNLQTICNCKQLQTIYANDCKQLQTIYNCKQLEVTFALIAAFVTFMPATPNDTCFQNRARSKGKCAQSFCATK